MTDAQMNMERLIGAQVLLILQPDAFKALDIDGVTGPRFYANVSGFDGFGLWVEDPDFTITPAYDSSGNYIPAQDRKDETHKAHVLILWSYIQSIIYFPDKRRLPSLSQEDGHIGFIPRRQNDT
jgi:hypothetical protein